jgi:hypothetical protein
LIPITLAEHADEPKQGRSIPVEHAAFGLVATDVLDLQLADSLAFPRRLAHDSNLQLKPF